MIAAIDIGNVWNWVSAHPYEVVTAALAIWGWLKPRLPKEALGWLAKVGGKAHIQELMEHACQLAELKTDAERRAWVVKQLEEAQMPTVIADMLVAWMYKQWKPKR